MQDSSTVTRFPPQLPVKQIAAAAQALIDLLDALGGDVEAEDDDPAEENGDEETASWVEWHRMRGPAKRGPNFTLGAEDDEDDDAAEDDIDDSAVDDRPCDDVNMDLEPDHDAEIQTWSHPDDHPAELFIGRRPANANPPDAA